RSRGARIEIAREHPPRRIEHEIKTLSRIARTLDDGMDEKRQAALRILLGQPRDFGLYGLIRLADEKARRVPVNISEKRDRRCDEQREIKNREPEGRCLEEINQRHGANIRRLGPCAAAAVRNSGRFSLSAAKYAHRSHW